MRLAWFPLVAVWCVGLLAGAAAAQEPTEQPASAPGATATPASPADAPRAAQGNVLQSLRSFGSFGTSAGVMKFLADDDAGDHSLIRPSLQGVFRYRFSEDWVGIAEFGFGWNAYRDKGDTVLTVHSGTLGLFRHFSDALGFDWKAGGGLGVYRWNYKFDGKSLRDGSTQIPLRDIAPGTFLGIEAERRMSRHVTFLVLTQAHYMLSENRDDFPSFLGGNDAFVTTRLGVNYHFSPYEGILWEKQEKRVIRLESGKAGS